MDPTAFPGDDVSDLSQFDEAFASAPAQDEDVPDGRYQVNVDKVEITRSQTSHNLMLKWTLRILGPDQVGRRLFRNNMFLTEENVRWLKTDLYKAGLEIAKVSDLPARLAELLDVKLLVTVKTSGEFTNIYFNRRLAEDEETAASGSTF